MRQPQTNLCHAPRLIGIAGLALLAALAGCQSYRLEGVVVSGQNPGVYVMEKNDPRLDVMGIPEATITLTLDPNAMNPIQAGRTFTGVSGRFSLPVEHGAGLLEYEAMIVARAATHQALRDVFPLPGGGKALLVVLRPGAGGYKPQEDIVKDSMRYTEQMK